MLEGVVVVVALIPLPKATSLLEKCLKVKSKVFITLLFKCTNPKSTFYFS